MGRHGGEMGYDEGLIRPDLLIVEAGRGEVINPKRKDREAAILGIFRISY
jgi:cleavage and polyadenylation specificity factor subunit 2